MYLSFVILPSLSTIPYVRYFPTSIAMLYILITLTCAAASLQGRNQSSQSKDRRIDVDRQTREIIGGANYFIKV